MCRLSNWCPRGPPKSLNGDILPLETYRLPLVVLRSFFAAQKNTAASIADHIIIIGYTTL